MILRFFIRNITTRFRLRLNFSQKQNCHHRLFYCYLDVLLMLKLNASYEIAARAKFVQNMTKTDSARLLSMPSIVQCKNLIRQLCRKVMKKRKINVFLHPTVCFFGNSVYCRFYSGVHRHISSLVSIVQRTNGSCRNNRK